MNPAPGAFQPNLIHQVAPLQKIVILRASRIGDFINTIPVFRAVKRSFPDCELTVITLPILADVARRCEYIDRFTAFPGYPGIAEQFFDPKTTLRFLQDAQVEQYDLALQMQGSGVNSNPWMLMLGARYTAGFIRPGDPQGRLDAALPLPDCGYEVDRMLALPEYLGIPAAGREPEFRLFPEDQVEAERIMAGAPKPWIGIHPFARDETRRWPIERFISTAQALVDRFGGTVVAVGETQDWIVIDLYRPRFAGRLVNLAGQLTLPALGALIRSCSVFITADTGPAHIAYALQASTVTIFGSGDPGRNGPVVPGPFRILSHPVDCRPCTYETCPIGAVCLDAVTVDEAVSAASEVFSFP